MKKLLILLSTCIIFTACHTTHKVVDGSGTVKKSDAISSDSTRVNKTAAQTSQASATVTTTDTGTIKTITTTHQVTQLDSTGKPKATITDTRTETIEHKSKHTAATAQKSGTAASKSDSTATHKKAVQALDTHTATHTDQTVKPSNGWIGWLIVALAVLGVAAYAVVRFKLF